MAAEAVLHYNPPNTYGKTRCGRKLSAVKRYTTAKEDVTCNSCGNLIAKG